MSDEDARPSLMDRYIVDTRICTYRCGSCPYLERAKWSAHERHYQEHLAQS